MVNKERLDELMRRLEDEVYDFPVEAEVLWEKLIDRESTSDEETFNDLLTYLMVQYLRYREQAAATEDMVERKALGDLADYYGGFFRNPKATAQLVYTFCDDEVRLLWRANEKAVSGIWAEISEAVARVIQKG